MSTSLDFSYLLSISYDDRVRNVGLRPFKIATIPVRLTMLIRKLQ